MKENEVKIIKVPEEEVRAAALEMLCAKAKKAGSKTEKKKDRTWDVIFPKEIFERIGEKTRTAIIVDGGWHWSKTFPGDRICFYLEGTDKCLPGTITEIDIFGEVEKLVERCDLEALGMSEAKAREGVKRLQGTDGRRMLPMVIHFTLE